MSELLTGDNLVALLTLTSLEIVLGIDNIVFISVLSAKLPEEQQAGARRLGLMLAMGMRIVLLMFISRVMRLTEPMFSLFEHEVAGKDLILIGGGLFLLAKATFEIHDCLEGVRHGEKSGGAKITMGKLLVQVMLLDLVFSLDSVITAVGMADSIPVMVTAVVLAVLVMMLFANPIGEFIEKHPTTKMLALAFLLLVGFVLTAEGFGKHIEKGYVYFAMAFSLFVELINIRMRSKSVSSAAAGDALVVEGPVRLHGRYQARETS